MDSQGDYSDNIVGIISVFDGKVPYLQRNQQAKLYPGKWCIPSGHMKIGETPERAARRELEEETGYRVPVEAKMENLGGFEYAVESKGKSLKLNITIFMYVSVSDEKPKIHTCDEHSGYRYIDIEVLADKDKMFLYTHARGVSDFTPIDFKVIEEYMPKAYEIYQATRSKAKSIA